MKGITIFGVILWQSLIVHGNFQARGKKKRTIHLKAHQTNSTLRNFTLHFTELLAEQIAMKITQQFLHKVNDEIQKDQPFSNHKFDPLIPPLDDPLILNPIDVPELDFQIPDLFIVSGSFGFG